MFNHQKLKCYEMAMCLLKKVPSLTNSWPRGNYYLIDQLKRAMSSVPLNIAEGNGRINRKDRARFFGIARASAAEVAAIIEVAFALQIINQKDYNYFQELLLQIVKILYKLR